VALPAPLHRYNCSGGRQAAAPELKSSKAYQVSTHIQEGAQPDALHLLPQLHMHLRFKQRVHRPAHSSCLQVGPSPQAPRSGCSPRHCQISDLTRARCHPALCHYCQPGHDRPPQQMDRQRYGQRTTFGQRLAQIIVVNAEHTTSLLASCALYGKPGKAGNARRVAGFSFPANAAWLQQLLTLSCTATLALRGRVPSGCLRTMMPVLLPGKPRDST